MTPLLQRIVEAAKGADILDLLSEKLAQTDLQSLMLEVYRRRSSARTPADLLAEYQKGRFFGHAPFSEGDLAAWNEIARQIGAGQFEFLTLSPITPLGTCAVLAYVSQNWSVPTARTGEVISDATNVLALEAAVRRAEALKRNPADAATVHLSSTQRVVRPQAYANPNALAHFSLFCLVSSGRDGGSFGFEADAINAHLTLYLAGFRRYFGDDLVLTISYTIVGAGHPDARLEAMRTSARQYAAHIEEEAGRTAVENYYNGFCFHIWGNWPSGQRRQLVDGGTVNWTARLLSNGKERTFISGAGIDGLVALRKTK